MSPILFNNKNKNKIIIKKKKNNNNNNNEGSKSLGEIYTKNHSHSSKSFLRILWRFIIVKIHYLWRARLPKSFQILQQRVVSFNILAFSIVFLMILYVSKPKRRQSAADWLSSARSVHVLIVLDKNIFPWRPKVRM